MLAMVELWLYSYFSGTADYCTSATSVLYRLAYSEAIFYVVRLPNCGIVELCAVLQDAEICCYSPSIHVLMKLWNTKRM